MTVLTLARTKTASQKIIDLLEYAQKSALPREHHVRRWLEPRGTHNTVDLWQSNVSVRIISNGNRYMLSWYERLNADANLQYKAILTWQEQQLSIRKLDKTYLTTMDERVLKEYSYTNTAQPVLAQTLCGWLGL